jgi:putative sigma-54 modulation protein
VSATTEEATMQLHVKGKNLEVSDSIRSYAERKLAKLDKQVHELTRVEVELAVEKNPSVPENQVAEATVWMKGHTLRAREATRDMKASIDELTEKLLRQVREERDKKAAKRRSGDKHANDDGTPT